MRLTDPTVRRHGYFRGLAVRSAVTPQEYAQGTLTSLRVRAEVDRAAFLAALERSRVTVAQYYRLKDRALDDRHQWIDFEDLLVVVKADNCLRNFLEELEPYPIYRGGVR